MVKSCNPVVRLLDILEEVCITAVDIPPSLEAIKPTNLWPAQGVIPVKLNIQKEWRAYSAGCLGKPSRKVRIGFQNHVCRTRNLAGGWWPKLCC